MFRYSVEEAILDGYLVDYEPVALKSHVRMHGVFLREGETVERVDTESGQRTLDQLEDEREFAAPDLERRIVAKLEKVLGKVDACKERLAKTSVLLKRFRQAILAAACSGKLSADWREDAPPNSLLPLEPPNPGDIINVEEIVDAPGSWRWISLQAVCDPGRSIC